MRKKITRPNTQRCKTVWLPLMHVYLFLDAAMRRMVDINSSSVKERCLFRDAVLPSCSPSPPEDDEGLLDSCRLSTTAECSSDPSFTRDSCPPCISCAWHCFSSPCIPNWGWQLWGSKWDRRWWRTEKTQDFSQSKRIIFSIEKKNEMMSVDSLEERRKSCQERVRWWWWWRVGWLHNKETLPRSRAKNRPTDTQTNNTRQIKRKRYTRVS